MDQFRVTVRIVRIAVLHLAIASGLYRFELTVTIPVPVPARRRRNPSATGTAAHP